jgi:alginate O-acetyltransferase complex protein AlgI
VARFPVDVLSVGWGGLHGLFLSIHRLWSHTRLREKLVVMTGFQGLLWNGLMISLTFHAVCLGWWFFRITNLRASWVCVQKWFVFDSKKMLVGGSADGSLWMVLRLYALGAWLLVMSTRRHPLHRIPHWLADKPFVRGAVWDGSLSLIILAILMAPGGDKPAFIIIFSSDALE